VLIHDLDYLADCVDVFLTDFTDQNLEDSELKLGFTFSFPVEQTALNKGRLLSWTKGFAVRNAVGHDVVQLLQDAFDRKHLHVKCVALVNDVSHYITTLWTKSELIGPDRRCSAIPRIYIWGVSPGSHVGCFAPYHQYNHSYLHSFGTGTNGAYIDDVAKITKLGNSAAAAKGGYMVVNTEWGAFDNKVCAIELSWLAIKTMHSEMFFP